MVTNNLKQSINNILCSTLKSQCKINNNLVKNNIEEWDSLKHITIITALEEHFNVQFEPEEIEMLNSSDKILDIISKKY